MDLTLRDVMTPRPHTIGEQQPLGRAHDIMSRFHIRHLPVLREGELTGLVSLRDLDLLETLDDVDPATVEVSEAMSTTPFAVEVDTPLATVVEAMAEQRIGAAIALDAGRVVGIFTAADAVRTLAQLVRAIPGAPGERGVAPPAARR